jgi:hypothetical protein
LTAKFPLAEEEKEQQRLSVVEVAPSSSLTPLLLSAAPSLSPPPAHLPVELLTGSAGPRSIIAARAPRVIFSRAFSRGAKRRKKERESESLSFPFSVFAPWRRARAAAASPT